MKLIVLGPDSHNFKGGIAQFTTRLCDELARSVEVHHESWKRMYPPFLTKREFRDTISKVKTGSKQSNNELDYLNPITWFMFVRRVAKLAPNKLVVTWIHPVHSPVYFTVLLLVRLFIRTEIVLLCHNVFPHEPAPMQKPLTRLVLWMVDQVIVHGSTEAKLAEQMISRENIKVLYHPLFDVLPESNSKVAPTVDDNPALKMLVFGAIREYKGTSLLLQTIATLREEGYRVKLLIAGEPFDNQHEHLEKEIKRLNLQSVVDTRFEYIANEQIKYLFDQCNVAMYPYLNATQSGSLAMAYACGVPVIATRVGGLTDVVADGISGYQADVTVDSLAEAIKRFIAEPISSDSVSEFAQKKLSWERYAKELVDS